MTGGIIRHIVSGTRVIEHRRGEQGPTVHLRTDANNFGHNRIDGGSLPEAPAKHWRVVAPHEGRVLVGA